MHRAFSMNEAFVRIVLDRTHAFLHDLFLLSCIACSSFVLVYCKQAEVVRRKPGAHKLIISSRPALVVAFRDESSFTGWH